MKPTQPSDSETAFPAYCMNVHPARTSAEVSANLRLHARAVADGLGVRKQEVGIWIPRSALPDAGSTAEAADWVGAALAESGLVVAACNGFPFDAFHAAEVKQRVYRPDWTDRQRAAYTLDLARLLATLDPVVVRRPLGISTVPIGWPSGDPVLDGRRLEQAAVVIADVLEGLARLEEETGRAMRLEIEPEPGCLLDTPDDVVSWVHRHLRRHSRPDRVERYLGICHDVCHLSVMQQDQRTCLHRYRDAGLVVSRLQISNAPEVRFGDVEPAEHPVLSAELGQWAEPRYMHQTSVKTVRPVVESRMPLLGRRTKLRDDGLLLFDDLPDALEAAQRCPELLDGTWRVHFHVPLFLERVGRLHTTQQDIDACLCAAAESGPLPVVEAETYAWSVMPQESDKPRNLYEDIASELRWLGERVRAASKLKG